MKTVVLIPSYKPNEKLLETIENIQKKINCDIVIVDDGGKEAYQDIFLQAKILNCTVLSHLENKGKGAALKTGIAYVQEHIKDAQHVITVDADGQHAADDILNLIKASETTSELILGVRDFNQKHVPLKSKLGNKISALYFKLMTKQTLNDTQTGLRLIPRSLFQIALITPGDRYEYEMHFLFNVIEHGQKFKTVPIQTIYFDQNQQSHFHVLKDSYRIYQKPIQFMTTALLSFIVDIAFFVIVIKLFGNIALATVIGRSFSGIFNYFVNAKFVFKKEKNIQNFIKYGITFLLTMFLSAFFVELLSTVTSQLVLVKIFVDFLLFLFNFYLQSNFVFRRTL